MFIYKLISENLTSLSRMGDTSTENWTRYFSTLSAAKAAAEEDYDGPISWSRTKNPTSGDLRHVMYDIIRIDVEE